jgi:hypothetical protein
MRHIKGDDSLGIKSNTDHGQKRNLKIAVFWDAAPCSLMMEAVSTSETSVDFYETISSPPPFSVALQL